MKTTENRLPCFLIDYRCFSQYSEHFKELFSPKKDNSLKQVYFLWTISSIAAIKHNLIYSPLANSFPCLGSKGATQKLGCSLIITFHFCEKILLWWIFHYFLNFYDHRCVVSCDECWNPAMPVFIVLCSIATVSFHNKHSALPSNLIIKPSTLHHTFHLKSTYLFLVWPEYAVII